ncbi:hypothetical protein CTAYLR_006669 [Chrysophaeum taylorii]|uniref:RPA43 OB domain-containing protein n=1 Tax=Chrysophaeum taylorii TaxID=2483200 RepID=A0AAD7UDE4_9STRA|nr:hypothetical protein CTAYLR_006669 [Chrysophaeum taylorii]
MTTTPPSSSKKKKRKKSGSPSSFKEVALHARFSLLPHALDDIRIHVFGLLQDALMRYNEQIGGAPIAFSDIGLAPGCRHGRVYGIDPQVAHIFVEVRLKACVFCPEPSQHLVGRVTKVGADFVSLLVYGQFNASIASGNFGDVTYDEATDRWTRTDETVSVQLNTRILFELLRFETQSGILAMEGKFIRVVGQDDAEPSNGHRVGC